MQGFLLTFLAIHAQLCVAVKGWMFKRCDQNPFCERNREYAQSPNPSTYRIDPHSVDFSNPASIRGNIIKSLSEKETEVANAVTKDNTIVLPFTLEIITDDIIRFLVDELERKFEIEDKDLEAKLNTERFSPADYMLDASQAHLRNPKTMPKLEATSSGLSIEYGTSNKVLLSFSPLRLEVSHRGETQVVLNKANQFNFEHSRSRREHERNSNWEDRFDGYTDYHLRGPESVAMDTSFEGYSHLYGIPEHADSLDLRDTQGKEPYRLFNVDIFEYETKSPMPMYGSIPLITSQKPKHAVGVFWLNAADTYVDISKKQTESAAHWMSEAGKLDVYVLVGDTPKDVLSSYGTLTGTSQLPQQFSIGYHQCRWNYQSQEELLSVHARMDENEFPFDAIWLDLEWSDDRRYFAWNKRTFPDAEKMLSDLDETKRKLVVLNDPHIKAKPDYDVFTDLRDNGLLIKDMTGSKDYHAHCWPGDSSWVDSFNPTSWQFWKKFHALGTKLGGYAKNIYIWSDMSEPSVFSGSETTAHKSIMHHGGWQHRDVHNLYGQTIFNMTYDALNARYNKEQRPFVLTRSFFAGSQKLGPTWTGDNQAEWEYLRAATPTILTLGAAGYPFTGADVGGFFKNPSDELLLRWYQIGIFYPFFRAHAHIESRYREPYLLDKSWRDAVRESIELRYQLLPELYTAFWDANQQLAPIMRPLFFEYPNYPEVYGVEDQFLVGSSLMSKPITQEGQTSVEVLMPGNDIFYNYFTGEEVGRDGPSNSYEIKNVQIDTIPLFVRGGHIVFRKDRKRRSSQLMRNDPYTLLIAVDHNGNSHGHLYNDDGVSFEYDTKSEYLVADVDFSGSGIKGTPRHSASHTFANHRVERIIVYGAQFTRAESSSAGSIHVHPIENGFIIRNPAVSLEDNWFIQLY